MITQHWYYSDNDINIVYLFDVIYYPTYKKTYVVGQNIAVHSFCLLDSFNIISPKLLQSSTVECALKIESEFYVW